MAKSSRKRKTAPETAKKTKKQIALGRKEARQNRIILILVSALIAVIVLILAVGVIRACTQAKQPSCHGEWREDTYR
jgi:ABC-type lipoprotein release transport system permease subunit